MSPRPNAPAFELGAGVYIISPEGKLLLADQERPGRRNWVSFGGGIEHGESIEQCAIREAREESGLHVRLQRLIAINEFWSSGRFWGVGFLFLAEPDPWPQEVLLPERDGSALFHDHAWFTRDQLPALNMPPEEFCLQHWPPEVTRPVVLHLEFD